MGNNGMPIYNYQARTKGGDVRTGRVEAASKKRAIEVLQHNELIVVAVEEIKEVPIYARRVKFLERIKSKDIVILTRQLTTLFEAEVPLVAALQTVANQTESSLLREKLFEMSADVEGGGSLSDALSKHPGIFSEFYLNMVRSGELSGKLQEVLTYLADHIEREYLVVSRVKGAMIYPAFVLTGFLVTFAIMMIFVIPQLSSILEESGQELPIFTEIIIGVSEFVRSSWYILLFGIVGGIILFLRYIKTESGKAIWDRAQLKLPIFGGILTKVYLFRFTESLGTLIEGGVSITQALAVSRDVTGNTVYKSIINEVQDEVKRGGTIGGALVLHTEIPPLVTQMIAVGEQAGKLVPVLRNVARFYQKDVDNAIDNITSLIEPILIVTMGLGVGLLVAGVMLPIYNMVGAF